MAICRFYAQGHCRYGDRCWNEHPANASQGYGQQQWSQGSGRGYRGSSNQQWSDQRHDDGGGRRKVGFVPSMQNRYSPLDQSSSTSQHAPSVDRQQILETVKKDMEEWLQSGMWMFSSYGFSKSQKSLAGLEDTSPEELRYFTYEAREAGKWNQYSQVITQSVLEVTKRRNDLKFPDAAIKTKIIQVYIGNTNIRTVFSSPLSTHAILSGSDGIQAENTISTIVHLWVLPVKLLLFLEAKEHETNTTIFGNQSATSTLFGNQPAATTNTVFGNQPAATTSTLFGNQPAATTNTLFGNQPAATTSTLFGNQPAATTSTLFGNQPAATNNNVFGNQPAATTSTLFGNQPAATNNNVFGNQPAATTSTLFGNQPAATTSTLFENQPAAASSTIFGNPPASGSSVFGSTASISQTPGLFGNPPQTAEFVTSTASDSLYTNISDLTDAERGQFESKTFTLGRIPVRPPPREMI
ncbi:LOW QUALITY PROTEIN: nucleoporin NUP42-like [Saccoglossus kowalevskii]